MRYAANHPEDFEEWLDQWDAPMLEATEYERFLDKQQKIIDDCADYIGSGPRLREDCGDV